MKSIRNMKRPRLATIVAALALFIAIGGTATAASLINGKDIKKGTVTAKQLKNKTITKGKLKPALVKSLKGQQGAQGQTGPTGPAGANGTVTPVNETEIGPENVAANTDKTIASVAVPQGNYVVMTDFNYSSASNALVNCAVKNGAAIVARSSTNGEVDKNSIAINAVAKSATSLSVVCSSSAAGSASNIHLIAIPTQG